MDIKDKPIHPGKYFLENYMEPLKLSFTETADILQIDLKTLIHFVKDEDKLTDSLAKKIAKATNTSAVDWMQMQFDLSVWSLKHMDLEKVKAGSLFNKN